MWDAVVTPLPLYACEAWVVTQRALLRAVLRMRRQTQAEGKDALTLLVSDCSEERSEREPLEPWLE